MTDISSSPFRSLLILVGLLLLGMGVGNTLAGLLLLMVNAANNATAATDPVTLFKNLAATPGGWFTIMAAQGMAHVCSFLLPALIYWQYVERNRWANFQFRPLSAVAGLSLVAFVVIAFMPFDGLIIEANQRLDLPDALGDLENWMRQTEDRAAELTKALTTFSSPAQLAVALLVIGVLPALGEEVLFRGVLQRKIIGWTGLPHLSIWLTAALFSAIHLQFYGFLPRMLLGALFGYLYFWTGNIWVPILAHFTNNGFTVLMVWLHQRRVTDIDIESTDAVPPATAAVSLALTAGLLWYIRRANKN
jgi:uncharacterized protein